MHGQTRKSVIRAEESFPISGQGYTVGKLADKTKCNILIDMGASQSYMSKLFYMQSKKLHAFKICTNNTERIRGRTEGTTQDREVWYQERPMVGQLLDQ